ncbi:hypothetical protein GSI_14227 [Ganoderma sinense ZZ0214-1]|uniref:Uncharacterized protein n=1 Tax=Ganoderma sinense ZZ0214-1 TaxID=1077348 RepID=A0A2G8RSK1_9APHY|nr:hypothetical protein GSI_14227 [Ganoderma sinense ZZ0214-1]
MSPLTVVHSEPVARTSVSQVRSMLLSLGIPMELVLRIMSIAEYHPTQRTERPEYVRINAGGQANTNACWAAKLYLVSKPLLRSPEDQFWRVKKVIWELEGHDQGWVGDPERTRGEYVRASSWYDACIFRPLQADGVYVANLMEIDRIGRTFTDPKEGMLAVQELLRAAGWTMVTHGPDNDLLTWRLQSNRIAQSRDERHVFEWSVDQPAVTEDARSHGSFDGDGFVEALQPGDRIGIWMRAQLYGWECHTTRASVSIMYEFR